MAAATELRFGVAETSGEVSALLVRPPDARLLYVLAHGAGAGMRHSFLESIAQRLAERGIATLRYQFPYMERRAGRPDPPAVAAATVRSTAQAEAPLPGVRGLVFLGFPLHPPGRTGDSRAEHLAQVEIPMLFLQGDRDQFADLKFLEPVVKRLGDRATLHLVEGGDHSFRVPKRSGKTAEDVMTELVATIDRWATKLL